MKRLLLAMSLLCGAVSLAQAGHVSVGIGIGQGWGYVAPHVYRPVVAPGFYYPPAYYSPPPAAYYPAPVVISPPGQRVYVERNDLASTSRESSGDWYYCRKPEGYYPYVQACPGGWMRAQSRPADLSQE
jgi:hypothetical protein